MSTLQVSNVHLESTANNRIEYAGSNTVNLYAGGINVLSALSSGLQASKINLEGTTNNRIEYVGSNTVNIYVGGTKVIDSNSSTFAITGNVQVSNVHLESTANNRIEYAGSNTVNIYAGGTNVLSVNSSTINIPVAGSISIGNTTVNSTVNSTSISIGSNNLTVGNSAYFVSNGNVGIGTNTPSEKLEIVGNITPASSNTYDLGTSSLRWRNIYTNDLNLNNGIGDYTIVEGEDDLFLYNNKKGKVYKFALVEVDPSEAPKKAI